MASLSATSGHLSDDPSSTTVFTGMPSYWKLEFHHRRPISFLLSIAFKFLCVVSFGHADLDRCWEICTSQEEAVWTENKKLVSDRITTTTVVAGLLLSSTAAFATTTPPVPHMLDYNEGAPYVCLLLSFSLTLGGLIVGSAVLFVMSKCEKEWFKTTLMGSRLNVCCTLIMVGYPFLCIGIATLVLAFGLLGAAWTSQNAVIRDGCVFVLIIPASLTLLFAWTQASDMCERLRNWLGTDAEKPEPQASQDPGHAV